MAEADRLTVAQAADEFGLSGSEVYALVFARRLGFTEATNGRILVPRAALDRYQPPAERPLRATA